MKIFVSNLSFRISSEELGVIFSEFGVVNSAAVIEDKETGRSRGFGFVDMPNTEEAKAAISSLNGTEQLGRQIAVSEAQPRSETNKPSSERGGRW